MLNQVLALSGRALELETRAYIAACTVPPNGKAKAAYNGFVRALKAAGIWSKGEAGVILAAHSEQASRVDLFQPSRVGVASGTIDHVPYSGRKGDGTTGRIASGWNPGDGLGGHLVTQDSNTFAMYVEDTVMASNGDLGAGTFLMNTRGGAGVTRLRNSATTTDTLAAGDGQGFFAMSRDNSASYKAFVNALAPVTKVRTSAAPTNIEVWWAGWNDLSAPQYSPRRLSFIGAFSALTDAEIDSLRLAILALRSALSAI